MSRVCLCEEMTAEHPLLLEEEGIKLYSFEELCYYLYENAEMVEESFFNERLCRWLDEGTGLKELSSLIRSGINQEKSGYWCMEQILQSRGYYSREEIAGVLQTTERMVHKSPLERAKLRGDRYLKEGRYRDAILEYRKVLKQARQEEDNSGIVSCLLHNMGTSYVRQMLFAQAADCYKKAYESGQKDDSREDYLLALACLEGQIPEDLPYKVEKHKMLTEKKQSGDRAGYDKLLEETLQELRAEYRKSD